ALFLLSWPVAVVVYFFFSSRRRHTRSKRDWSSDVCSSDLQTCRRDLRRAGKLSGDIRKRHASEGGFIFPGINPRNSAAHGPHAGPQGDHVKEAVAKR